MPRDSSDGGGANGRSSGGGTDEETGGHHKETFADHVQYTVRKTLLSRFYFGVCAYLLASISELLYRMCFMCSLSIGADERCCSQLDVSHFTRSYARIISAPINVFLAG
jgi:hypothetical protein